MIESVINIVIAVIGIIIAFLQFKIERLERKRERIKEQEAKNKEAIMRNIAEQTKSLDELEKCLNTIKTFSEMNFTPEKEGELFSLFQDACLWYRKSSKIIESLYSELVKNEAEFSLSYGYGRYIDAFREFLLLDYKVEKIANDITLMFQLAKKYTEEQASGEKIDVSRYFEEREDVFGIFNELGEYSRNILMLVKEIRIKYPLD